MAITRLSLRQPATQSRRLKAAFAATVAAALLTGCATPAPGLSDLQRITLPERLAPKTATVLMLGEQHDAPVHQQLQRLTVQQLSAQQRLGALVLEMADRGHSTESLPADASESAVQQALNWRDNAWPWASYGPVVMQAVRAGVPVHGSNLPFKDMRAVMTDARWDTRVDPAIFATQKQAVTDGHCGLLPESQLTPMTRIQIARDETMAQAIIAASQPGRVTLYIAGSAHTDSRTGVPQHLQDDRARRTLGTITSIRLVADGQTGVSAKTAGDADWYWHTHALPPQDYCAGLRAHFKRGA